MCHWQRHYRIFMERQCYEWWKMKIMLWMLIYLGKKDPPSHGQWALKQTVLGKGFKYPKRVNEVISEHFCVDNYLDLLLLKEITIDLLPKIQGFSSLWGFNLAKFLWKNQNILKPLSNSILSLKLKSWPS